MALPIITNNAPSAGYISWTAFSIQYGGVGYSVGAGSSNKKFVWWEYNGGTPILQTSDTLPDLAVEDYLLFLNKSGIGLIVDTTQVIDGSLIVAGSILADGIGANQIQSWHVNANAITAGKIAAGAITSNEIAAGAISAEKLSIGAVGDNMVLNGSFEDGTQGFTVIASGAGAVADVVTGVSSSGANALRLVRGTAANLHVGQTPAAYIPVTSVAGRSWYVACRAGAGSALASGFYLRVLWFQADKVTPASTASVDVASNVALTTAWSVFEGAVTPPANARYMRVSVINALSGSTMYVDEITAHEVVMAAQIGSGQITTAKLAANAVTANQIAANAVTAEKVLLSGANLIPGADLRVLTGWDSANITPTLHTATRGRGLFLARNTTDLDRSVTSAEFGVTAGATYTVSATVLSQSGGAGLQIEIVPVNASGVDQAPIVIASTTSDNNWKTIRGQWTPAASTYRGAKFRFVGIATTGTSGNDYLIQPRMVEAAVAEMIVDGAVTAEKITANSALITKLFTDELMAGVIKADMLMPNVGETLNLVANEAIQFIVGRQDAQDVAIEAAQQTADAAEADAQAARTAAGTASAAAAVADGKALVAQVQAQDVSDRFTAHQAVFRVTATGAEVASADGSNVLALTPSGIQIIQGGTPASTWDAGRLIVNETIINRIQMANHVAEKSGATRTVFRPV